jgi:deoxynucleoside triphosphate triphosphohydrolase SAMHD1
MRGVSIEELPGYSGFREKQYLFDIVVNKRNAIDVDKFDYITRDSKNLGIASDFDSSRLIKLSAVINGQLCYHTKSLGCVRGIFELRHDLFSNYYFHKTC